MNWQNVGARNLNVKIFLTLPYNKLRWKLCQVMMCSLLQNKTNEITSRIPTTAAAAFGKSTKVLCTLTDHLDEFIRSYGYSPAIGGDAKSFIKNRFSKHFPQFEWISSHELREWVVRRMDGSDGGRAWSRTTAGKNLSYVKAYWYWCLDRNLTTAPNLAMHENILPRANKTKVQRKFGKKATIIAVRTVGSSIMQRGIRMTLWQT